MTFSKSDNVSSKLARRVPDDISKRHGTKTNLHERIKHSKKQEELDNILEEYDLLINKMKKFIFNVIDTTRKHKIYK